MTKVEKLHRKFENKMVSKHIEPKLVDSQSMNISEDGASLSLMRMAGETKKMLEIIMPSQETRGSIWEFKGYYYNTIKSYTSHDAYYTNEKNNRAVIGNDKVKIELKEVKQGVVEIYTIQISKEFRKKGLGKDIMENLMKIAQVNELDLQLVPVAFGDNCLSYKEFFKETLRLRKWYYELGFEYSNNSAIMTW